VGVLLVDIEGDPDHHRAVVIGAGEGRGDHGEAQRRPFEGAREVNLALRVEGMGARSGGDVGGADFRARRAARTYLLGTSERARGADDVCFGAVGDAVEVGAEARRHREVELAQVLVAVVAIELQSEA